MARQVQPTLRLPFVATCGMLHSNIGKIAVIVQSRMVHNNTNKFECPEKSKRNEEVGTYNSSIRVSAEVAK